MIDQWQFCVVLVLSCVLNSNTLTEHTQAVGLLVQPESRQAPLGIDECVTLGFVWDTRNHFNPVFNSCLSLLLTLNSNCLKNALQLILPGIEVQK